jgi:acetylxylan esterase
LGPLVLPIIHILSAFILAAAFVAAQNVTTCYDGLYILVARGTNVDPGTGLFGDIADELANRIPGSEVSGLDYPASLTDPIYIRSVREGGEAMKDAVEGYREECPEGADRGVGIFSGIKPFVL